MALYQSGAGLAAMVGVGTTSPTSNLHVYGTQIATGTMFSVVNTTATGNVAQLTSSSGGGLIINSVGNVGINVGASTPITYSLQVTGNSYYSNSICFPTSGVGLYWGAGYSRIIDDGDLRICTDDNMHFNTGCSTVSLGSEKMVILSSGNVGIGKTDPSTLLQVNGTITTLALTSTGTIQTSYTQGSNLPSTGQAYFYNPTNSANQDASCAVKIAGGSARNAYYAYDVAGVAGFSHGITGATQNLVFRASWDMSSATLYTMDRSGNFTATGSVISNSDRRIKTDLEIIPDALEKIKKINGYTFTRTDIDSLGRQAGVIAQEVMDVLPEVVHENEEGMYSVSYGNLISLLIEGLKEETRKREDLEKLLLNRIKTKSYPYL